MGIDGARPGFDKHVESIKKQMNKSPIYGSEHCPLKHELIDGIQQKGYEFIQHAKEKKGHLSASETSLGDYFIDTLGRVLVGCDDQYLPDVGPKEYYMFPDNVVLKSTITYLRTLDDGERNKVLNSFKEMLPELRSVMHTVVEEGGGMYDQEIASLLQSEGLDLSDLISARSASEAGIALHYKGDDASYIKTPSFDNKSVKFNSDLHVHRCLFLPSLMPFRPDFDEHTLETIARIKNNKAILNFFSNIIPEL